MYFGTSLASIRICIYLSKGIHSDVNQAGISYPFVIVGRESVATSAILFDFLILTAS